MKLFYMPNACSMGIHFLLEEIGAPYELEKVDFTQGAQYQPPFVSLNPKSKVPVLQLDDGQTVTEFPAIAFYLGRTFPQARLLPEDVLGQARALELLDYLVATVHMRGFTRMFRTATFTPNPADEPQVVAQGRAFIEKGFAVLEPVLGDQDFIMGDLSIVEGALFFLEHWARFRADIKMPPNFEAHLDRLLARPAAQQVRAVEGLV